MSVRQMILDYVEQCNVEHKTPDRYEFISRHEDMESSYLLMSWIEMGAMISYWAQY